MNDIVTFDSESIIGAPYITRIVQHESSPDRRIISHELTREDGSVFVSSRYREKRILIEGILTEDDAGDLEEQIDAMKELLSREEKNLDISWNGETRRYVATCSRHTFDRDHFHLRHVPFSAEFVASAGFGIDTVTTTAIDDTYDTTTDVSVEPTILGTAPPKPIITLTGNNWPSGCRGISIVNEDTGERFLFSRNVDWGTDSIVEINCALKKITHTISGVPTVCDFAGLIPQFKVGANNFTLKAGAVVNQATREASIADVEEGAIVVNSTSDGKCRTAQKFSLPYTDATVQGIRIAVLKLGSPLSFNVRIETDADGVPSGSLVHADATQGMSQASIGTSMGYWSVFFPNPISLQANITYWIVCEPGNTPVDSSTNYFLVGIVNGADEIYTDGGYMADIGNPIVWGTPSTIVSQAFQLLSGGRGGASNVDVLIQYEKTYL